jgi:hypothetical protein
MQFGAFYNRDTQNDESQGLRPLNSNTTAAFGRGYFDFRKRAVSDIPDLDQLELKLGIR